MKMPTLWATITTVSAAAFATGAAAEQKFQKLTGAQIEARFVGMELTDESHWGETFGRNGTLAITSMGHRSLGKWSIRNDRLCVDTGERRAGAAMRSGSPGRM